MCNGFDLRLFLSYFFVVSIDLTFEGQGNS